MSCAGPEDAAKPEAEQQFLLADMENEFIIHPQYAEVDCAVCTCGACLSTAPLASLATAMQSSPSPAWTAFRSVPLASAILNGEAEEDFVAAYRLGATGHAAASWLSAFGLPTDIVKLSRTLSKYATTKPRCISVLMHTSLSSVYCSDWDVAHDICMHECTANTWWQPMGIVMDRCFSCALSTLLKVGSEAGKNRTFLCQYESLAFPLSSLHRRVSGFEGAARQDVFCQLGFCRFALSSPSRF
jgi:hypothetical protein